MVTWTNDLSERRVEEGKAFVASVLFTTVSDNASADVLLHLPASSEKDIDVNRVELTAGGDSTGEILKNVNITSTGDVVSESNILISSTRTSDLDVYEGGTFTGGTTHLEWFMPGGEKNRSIGVSDNAPRIHMDTEGSDANVLLRITNDSGSAERASIVLAWQELDESHG